MSIEKEGFEIIRSKRGRPTTTQPIVSVGKNHVYFNAAATKKINLQDDESITFARKGEEYFAYRTEFGAKGSYRAKVGVGGTMQVQAQRVILQGMPAGRYLLDNPIHVSDVDLFKLNPNVEEAE